MIRVPEPPLGCVKPSSGSSSMISELPSLGNKDFFPDKSVASAAVSSTSTSPAESASTFCKSPKCAPSGCINPCSFPSRSEEQRLNSSHVAISYAVFCLKKKNKHNTQQT